MPARRPRQRVPLTRARVLDEAVAVANEEGLDAVSMRRLADRLDVVPMAIYKHVADKEDLLDGMVDVVVAAFPNDRAGDWRAQLRGTLLGARVVVDRHPWARRAMETRTTRSPTVLRHMERVTDILLAAGFSPDLTHHVMHALGSRIWGFSPELFNEPGGGPPRRVRKNAEQPDPAEFPAILAIVADATARRPGGSCDEDFEFTFALDLLLDGIERLHADGWQSNH